jgi:hypothetical protein
LQTVFGNQPVVVHPPPGTRISLTLFDLTGKVVVRKRVDRDAVQHLRRLNLSDNVYLMKTAGRQ